MPGFKCESLWTLLRTVSQQRTPRYTEICQVTVGNPSCTAERENGSKNIRMEKKSAKISAC